MEAIEVTITQLPGAVKAQIEQVKKLEFKLAQIETQRLASGHAPQSELAVSRTEKDLEKIRKLLDCVRDL